jgi:hypothetical protein
LENSSGRITWRTAWSENLSVFYEKLCFFWSGRNGIARADDVLRLHKYLKDYELSSFKKHELFSKSWLEILMTVFRFVSLSRAHCIFYKSFSDFRKISVEVFQIFRVCKVLNLTGILKIYFSLLWIRQFLYFHLSLDTTDFF